MKKNVLLLVLAMLAEGAFALCINPLGCEPKTYDDCIQDASTRPTSEGVKLARELCESKFKRADANASRSQAAKDAAEFPERWNRLLPASTDASSLTNLFGEPYLSIGPNACSKVDAELPTNKRRQCFTLYWQDARAAHTCGTTGNCFFRAEVLTDPQRSVAGWWPDSF